MFQIPIILLNSIKILSGDPSLSKGWEERMAPAGVRSCLTTRPLRGSRFVSERLQTPLLGLPLVGKGGLADDIDLHVFQALA